MEKKCKVEGCVNNNKAKGYCNMHYIRLKKHGDCSVTKRKGYTKCSIEGCIKKGSLDVNGKRYFRKGLCGMHYARLSNGYIGLSDNRLSTIEGDIAKIPLGLNGKDGFALVDKEFAYLDKHHWHITHYGYACSPINGRNILMHHVIIGKPIKPMVTDHINRNKLDNRKENLRHCTQSMNMLNTDIRSDNKTGHRGIYLSKRDKTYCVQVKIKNKCYTKTGFKCLDHAILHKLSINENLDELNKLLNL